MRRKKSFTLVELLVAMAIIGLLAAIVLPALQRAREEARETEAVNELHALDSGIRMFEMDNGQYPPNGNANLIASLQAGSYVNKLDAGDLRQGEMLDPWKNPYVYLNPGIINPKSYDLYCLREDGRLFLAGESGMSLGPVASVFKETGTGLSPSLFSALSSPSRGFTPPTLDISSPDINIGGGYSLSGITLDAWNLLDSSSSSSIAQNIAGNGFQTSISVSASSTSGLYSANAIWVYYTDSGNYDYNVAKVAAVLAHEGLHAMYG